MTIIIFPGRFGREGRTGRLVAWIFHDFPDVSKMVCKDIFMAAVEDYCRKNKRRVFVCCCFFIVSHYFTIFF